MNRQLYQSTPPIDVPNPILVYSADGIAAQFNGTSTSFDLTRAGYQIPAGQLDGDGANLIVNIGGVIQKPGAAYSVSPKMGRIVFTEAPPAGVTCNIRVVSSEDESATLDVIVLTSSTPFDGAGSTFLLNPVIPTVSANNTFVFLGGTEQNPFGNLQISPSYYISNDPKNLVYLSNGPIEGTVYDYRSFVSGAKYRAFGIQAFFVNSADDISGAFDGARVAFPVEVGGDPVDPSVVNGDNMFVSLGGVMQLPADDPNTPVDDLSYTFSTIGGVPTITFVSPPAIGTSSNIRIFTSSRYITCPLPDALTTGTLRVGPGVDTNADGQITHIDPGVIS